MSRASSAPDFSPIAIIRVTIGGKIFGLSASGDASVSPCRTLSDACMTTSSMRTLPAVEATISRAPRIGTPDEISVAKVRVKRETATFLNSGPKTGMKSLSQSNWRLPTVVCE